jgi:alpha-amylase
MADELERLFGRRPRGAWLAERVWEPDLPTSLAVAGYDWTILDDAHFRAAAIPEEALWGPYTTDDQGRVLTIFGTEQGLRYRIPFAEVDDVIGYLRDHATERGDRLGTMGDDGEKFGGWPTTFEHCWGPRGWVERFFAALDENADWLATTTPSEWLDGRGSIGRVYVPTGSYAEMGEWALPADESVAFSRALHEAVDRGRPEARWLRGAMWRNFQVKYREINDLHKQMLRASDLVEAMPPGASRDAALDHLFAGQSNDCYWHGLFGGIYLADLRVAALRNLIQAEDLALGGPGAAVASGTLVDLDLDGAEEVLLQTDGVIVGVKLEDGGGIGRWDLRAAAFPLAAAMRRRPEAYHEKLRAHERTTEPSGAEAASATSGVEAEPGQPASIHEIVSAKQSGLSGLLHYDAYERRSASSGAPARDHAGGDRGWLRGGPGRHADRAVGARVARRRPHRAPPRWPPLELRKTIVVGGGRLDPTLSVEVEATNVSRASFEGLLGIEFAVMLLGGGHNPAAFHEVGGRRIAHDEALVAGAVTSLGAGNEQAGVTLETTTDGPVDAWISPIETVSNSESGFELVYQGSCVLLHRQVELAPGASATIRVEQRARAAVDHAVAATAVR